MKTRTITRIAIVFASVLTLGYARAAEPVRIDSDAKHSELERTLDHQLNRVLSFPVLANDDMTGKVFVSFVIDKEGKVEVIECNSTHDELKAYVLRKLARIDIGENPDGVWKTTHMVINFRKENA
ncbi:MAG TPA: hypothetical protein PK760_02540 [Flavobacteriales bacterium]|nr:hypothetical protein [Flavobacteriales bacterium]